MTNPPTDEMRDAFEAWATEEHGAWLDKDSHGRYTIPAEESMWLGYQAALSHHGEVVAIESLRSLPRYEVSNDGFTSTGTPTVERDDQYGDWLKVEDLTALISKAEKV